MNEAEVRPGARIPSVGRALLRGSLGRCPACGAGRQTERWVRVRERCHRCGLLFERIEGHFIGAVGINTVISFGILLLSLVVSLVVTFPDFPVVPLILWHVGLAIVVPTFFLPLSRTLWTAIDIGMRPLAPDEVDWSVVMKANGH